MASATCRALNPDMREALAVIERARAAAVNHPEQFRDVLQELIALGLIERFTDEHGTERFRAVLGVEP